MDGNRKIILFVIALALILILSLIVFLTPVFSWLTGSGNNAGSSPFEAPPIFQPYVPPDVSPGSVSDTTPPEPPVAPPIGPTPPVSPATPKILVYTEAELQEIISRLVPMLNGSGKGNIEYLNVKLDQGRMLISARGNAMGYQAETENLEITFAGLTVSVRGKVKAMRYETALALILDIITRDGKPAITMKEFNMGSLGLVLNMLGYSKEKIQNIINSSIESGAWKLPLDLQSISIQDGKLTIGYK